MAVDEKVLQDKMDKNEPLTKEEEAFLLSDEPAVEGYKPAIVEPQEVAPADKGKEAAPEKKVGDAEKKPEDAAPAPDDSFVRLERELAKPEGKEDLKDFTDREKAYFHQMRRDRKARQKLEEERDAALFNLSKSKQPAEDKKPQEEQGDPIADLKKKDPTDLLTVADVLKVVESIQVKPKEESPAGTRRDPVKDKFLRLCESEARAQHPEDFDAVMELTEDIILNNPKYLVEVAQAMNAGENPAIKSYELIKADPEFANLFPVAKTKVEARKQVKGPAEPKKEEAKPPVKSEAEIQKERTAAAAQDKLEKNQIKTKTTGNIESGPEGQADSMSLEDYMNMSDLAFARLPKKTRQALLEKYG